MDYTYQIRVRRGTSAQFQLSNPILLDGEPGYATDLNYYKIGDGVTRWLDLPWTTGLKGDKGDKGDKGEPQFIHEGPTVPDDLPVGAFFLDTSCVPPTIDWSLGSLDDVDAPVSTQAGMLLGTIATGKWGPVFPPSGGGGGGAVTKDYVDAGDAANSAETQVVANELALLEDVLQEVKAWAGDPTPLHVNSTLSEWLTDLADEVNRLSARPAFSLDGILHVDMYQGFARIFSNDPSLETGEKWVEIELATTPAPGGTIPAGTNTIASSVAAQVRAGSAQGPVLGATGWAISTMALANYISQNRICRIIFDKTVPSRPTLTFLETLDAIPTGTSGLKLGALHDVSAPANTPVGKVLGTTATGAWGPVDPPSGGGGMDQAAADTRYVNSDGDTMTGQLTVASHGITVDSPGTAFFAIDRNSGASMAQFEFRTNGNQDFVLGAKGDAADRHFRIYTNGKEVDVLRIERSSGHISLLNGTDLTLANEPTAAKHATTKGYVDSRTPQVLVLGPSDPVPGGTPAGTVIVRKEA